MVNKTIVVKPDALKPLICEEDKPLALPMLPLQKIIAMVADTRCGPANIWNRTSMTPMSQNIFRGANVCFLCCKNGIFENAFIASLSLWQLQYQGIAIRKNCCALVIGKFVKEIVPDASAIFVSSGNQFADELRLVALARM